MRKDIKVNTSSNDIVLQSTNTSYSYTLTWVYEYDTFILGEVRLPVGYVTNQLYTTGIKVNIPYTPIYKPIRVRFMKDYGSIDAQAIYNPVERNDMFSVSANMYGSQSQQLMASQLLLIAEDTYILQLQDGYVNIWSGTQSDVVSTAANIQNRNFMLQCIPSNNYRYPTSGVGLIRYLHANVSQTDLADVLQSEFNADGVTVKNASFDSTTGNLELELDFSKVDN